jgi:hypothetical protein
MRNVCLRGIWTFWWSISNDFLSLIAYCAENIRTSGAVVDTDISTRPGTLVHDATTHSKVSR